MTEIKSKQNKKSIVILYHGHKTIPNVYTVKFLFIKNKTNLANAKFRTKS